MHIFFITEKWCDCDPGKGISNVYHNLFGSLYSTGLATQSVFHPDEFYQTTGKDCFTPLMFEIYKTKPDILFVTWYSLDILELLGQVRKRIGIPIVSLWWDSVSQMHMAEAFLPYVNLNIVVDSMSAYLESKNPEKYLALWPPQNPALFHNIPKKDIDVSFVGSVNGHPYRQKCIAELVKNDVGILYTGGQRESRITFDDYADISRRSKIILNFSATPDKKTQIKGRVIEATLCKALLLESDNIETSKRFVPNLEYVPFADEKDLTEKIRYYKSHDLEREEIALRGHERALRDYSAGKFWSTVLDRMRKL